MIKADLAGPAVLSVATRTAGAFLALVYIIGLMAIKTAASLVIFVNRRLVTTLTEKVLMFSL